MDTTIKARIDTWLTGAYDAETKSHLRHLLETGATKELTDAFYKDLDFGTGGMRGIMGVGTNRMNRYTIAAATQGLANYILKQPSGPTPAVVIAFDSRINSKNFATTAAEVLSANGIKVLVYPELRATPQLSFTVRSTSRPDCSIVAGIVITASHNPKEYNGYKVYWSDGAQVIPPHDRGIIAEVRQVTSLDKISFTPRPELIERVPATVDRAYVEMVCSQRLRLTPQSASQLRIVYTPLHGTGITQVPVILKELGFTDTHVVKEQATPDGNFPTVKYPNPEEREAMSLAVATAEKLSADLLMGTDPDSDRVGIGIKNTTGAFELINGNQAAAILFDYILESRAKQGTLTGKQYTVKTIVTSELLSKISAGYGVPIYNTLTGFKYIAGLIRELEPQQEYVVGGEESYGYLVGANVRDKDALSSCAMFAEIAAVAKAENSSIFARLLNIYRQHGLYREKLLSITKPGKEGLEEIAAMMKRLRSNPPTSFDASPVVELRDYDTQQVTTLATGAQKPTNLPRENVLQFVTADGSLITARPSGTEPKIKFYCSVVGQLASTTEYDRAAAQLDAKLERIIGELKKQAE